MPVFQARELWRGWLSGHCLRAPASGRGSWLCSRRPVIQNSKVNAGVGSLFCSPWIVYVHIQVQPDTASRRSLLGRRFGGRLSGGRGWRWARHLRRWHLVVVVVAASSVSARKPSLAVTAPAGSSAGAAKAGFARLPPPNRTDPALVLRGARRCSAADSRHAVRHHEARHHQGAHARAVPWLPLCPLQPPPNSRVHSLPLGWHPC